MTDTSLSGRFSQASPRQRWLAIVGVVVVIAAIAYGAYWLLYARFFESTDDAYVTGDTAQINSRTAGTILSIHANNTQAVRRGSASRRARSLAGPSGHAGGGSRSRQHGAQRARAVRESR